MKPKEIRELPSDEIRAQIKGLRGKLFKFRFHAQNEEMQRAGEIRQARRQLARMKTILRERELQGERSGEAGNGGT